MRSVVRRLLITLMMLSVAGVPCYLSTLPNRFGVVMSILMEAFGMLTWQLCIVALGLWLFHDVFEEGRG